MGTLNYTTSIASTRTIGEMQAMLAKHGASAVAVLYTNTRPAGLTFSLTTPHGPRHFSLPVDVPAVERLLDQQVQQRVVQKRYGSPDQAERTAWRVAMDWLAAQLATVEAQMASLDQVMLPYLHVDGDTTLYAAYHDRDREQTLALTTRVEVN